MISYECAIDGCTGSTPQWSCLCDLHRERLASGARLTDGVRPRRPRRGSALPFSLGSRSGHKKLSDEDLARGRVRRRIEDVQDARRLAKELEE